MRSTLSSILSFIVGRVFPANASKLGSVPSGSLLLHRIRVGEIKAVQVGEQGVAEPAREWNGRRWVLAQ